MRAFWMAPIKTQMFLALKGCNVRAQEEMLKNKGNLISTAASRNIFKFVWGGWYGSFEISVCLILFSLKPTKVSIFGDEEDLWSLA